MEWKVFHVDYPEDARVVDSFKSAKLRAWCMDHDFKTGTRCRDGAYQDGVTGIRIEPVKDKQ